MLRDMQICIDDRRFALIKMGFNREDLTRVGHIARLEHQFGVSDRRELRTTRNRNKDKRKLLLREFQLGADGLPVPKTLRAQSRLLALREHLI